MVLLDTALAAAGMLAPVAEAGFGEGDLAVGAEGHQRRPQVAQCR